MLDDERNDIFLHIDHRSMELYEKIQEGAVSEVTPRSSWRASREFRLQLVRELSVRTAKEAIEKASGGEADA